MDIVLAHDSFTQRGGAERVFENIHTVYPEAPVLTLVVDQNLKNETKDWKILESPLAPVYAVHPTLQHLLFLIPWAVDNFKVPGCDVLLSSSSGFIKGLRKPKSAIHINYCHTPTRFLWIDKDYVNEEVPRLLRPIIKSYLKRLAIWDLKAAGGVDYFIANSKETQKRIQAIYGRESTVIEPSINVNFWKPTQAKQDYFLIAGRLQPHKHNELIVELFNELGWPLHVVGTGRQELHLKEIAKSNITFLGRTSDEVLRDEYSGAKGFIYPQLEDFGIMPLEAAACGTATLGLAKGGSLETIVPGKTGEFFATADKAAIKEKLLAWDPNKYNADSLSSHARNFSNERFQERLKQFVDQAIQNHAHSH